jgi:poly(hydroxyalkanoate) depolymerase family esterase
MIRVRLAHLLQRCRRALGRLLRRSVQTAEPQPSHWSAGVFQQPRAGKFLIWTVPRRLNYRLYLPRNRTPSGKVPLLVMLHGCNQDAKVFAAGTRMNTLADEHECAVLYPEQSAAANGMRCWNWFTREVHSGQGEAALIVGLVQDLLKREAIDRQRVYVAGMSAGASMAETLALRWPQLFAACGLHSGAMYAAASSAGEALGVMRSGASASPQKTAEQLATESGQATLLVPAIVVHGSADKTVNPCNAVQIVALHLALAGLQGPGDELPSPTEERRYDFGAHSVLQRDYSLGATLLVRSLLIDGLGHAWSGGDAVHAFNSASGPDVSRIMLDFLLRHSRTGSETLAHLKSA